MLNPVFVLFQLNQILLNQIAMVWGQFDKKLWVFKLSAIKSELGEYFSLPDNNVRVAAPLQKQHISIYSSSSDCCITANQMWEPVYLHHFIHHFQID